MTNNVLDLLVIFLEENGIVVAVRRRADMLYDIIIVDINYSVHIDKEHIIVVKQNIEPWTDWYDMGHIAEPGIFERTLQKLRDER